MNNLLFISYGNGIHELEIMFSLLSVWRWNGTSGEAPRILIFTDRPERFSGLPVTVETIPHERWVEWSGPHGFNHRRKMMALRHALTAYEGSTALLDGDTWMRRPADGLFGKIGPGRSVMHLCEGRVSELRSPTVESLAGLLRSRRISDFGSAPSVMTADAQMWNSGVVGLDPSDAGLIDIALQCLDELCRDSSLHILEQHALSHVLGKYTQLQETGQDVFHYWPPYLRAPFQQKLPGILGKLEPLPLPERVRRGFRFRPRPGALRLAKVAVKRVLLHAGLLKGRVKTSEW